MQSTSHDSPGLHVAVIMDGNGRWATAQGLPRLAGHRAGAAAVRRVVAAAPGAGIGTLTLYAFSSDNWRRPRTEVTGLMTLFAEHLRNEIPRSIANGVRLNVIGRRDRLPLAVRAAIVAAERATEQAVRRPALELRIAIDYSSRDLLLQAAQSPAPSRLSRERFASRLAAAMHAPSGAPDVDLLIRTGGERRLSDFLLWECAYAELYFTDRFWPEFGAEDLELALADFRHRERRFGRLPARKSS